MVMERLKRGRLRPLFVRLYLGRQWLRDRTTAAAGRAAWKKYRDFTMVSRKAYVDNLLLASRVRDVPGCVIECGVWRGGMSAGLAELLGSDRHYCLFDSFEGLPPAKEIDGASALQWQQDKDSPEYWDNCSAEMAFGQKAMSMSPAKQVTFKKGWFSDTLPGFVPPAPIALLRLDGDWYDSTMQCLDALFPHVVPGGLIIVDDYYMWDGCSKAVHDFLSKHKRSERIRHTPLGVCYIVRDDAPIEGARPLSELSTPA